MWIHLNMYFEGYERAHSLEHSKWVEIVKYIEQVVAEAKPERFFFLFEPEPHCFLAMQVGDKQPRIYSRVHSMPKFFQKTTWSEHTGDEAHPSAVIDFFQAASRYAFFRASSHYKEGYENHDEVKLLHCFFNAQGLNHPQELRFYTKCMLHRGARSVEWVDVQFKKWKADLKVTRKLRIQKG